MEMVAKSNKDNRTITVHRLADKSVDNKRSEKKRERERELYKTIRWRLNSIRLDNNSSLFKVHFRVHVQSLPQSRHMAPSLYFSQLSQWDGHSTRSKIREEQRGMEEKGIKVKHPLHQFVKKLPRPACLAVISRATYTFPRHISPSTR